MKQLNDTFYSRTSRPIRAIQFGEGNFLRSFVDYMIDVANEQKITDIGVAVVKPIAMGSLAPFEEQDNLYTVLLQGRHQGEVLDLARVVSCLEQVVDPYAEYDRYQQLATLDTLEFVFSNTTEAGIVFDDSDALTDAPASSFPGKLTQWLYKRYQHFSGAPEAGLIFLPVELIEQNGESLRRCILQYVDLWELEDEFRIWICEHNIFCDTLVDRIVTGYPQDAPEVFQRLGYSDRLLAAAEPFGLWVIQGPPQVAEAFPLDQAGEPVLFTDDLTPYRERKVRILNGGHTSMVLAAYLAGEDIVRDCMANPTIRQYLEQTLEQEIIPTLDLPRQELEDFSRSVIERFENPFIDHSLLAISLNSVSKWKTRVLPSWKDSYQATGKLPPRLTFSLAALLAFYDSSQRETDHLVGTRGADSYRIVDSPEVLDFFARHAGQDAVEYTQAVLSKTEFWGEDLTAMTGLAGEVAQQLQNIREQGALAAMAALSD